MDLKEHYKQLFHLYGDSHKTAQWSSADSQQRRFQLLTEIAPLQHERILDFGCGTGRLYAFLQEKKVPVAYTGYDIVPEMVAYAERTYEKATFTTEMPKEEVDYILISGVFNHQQDDAELFYQEQLKRLFPLCRKGLAFNMLCSYVEYENPELYYAEPERVFAFCKKELSPFVTLRNDYRVKADVPVPFEFTVYVYKDTDSWE